MLEVYGLKDESEVDELYEKAYTLYESGKYYEAGYLFRILTAIDPLKPEYSLALGGCAQMTHQYRPAVTFYTNAGNLDPDNPIPFYHAGDCYMSLGESGMAIASFELAIKRMGDRQEYAILKQTATMLISGLKKEEGLS